MISALQKVSKLEPGSDETRLSDQRKTNRSIQTFYWSNITHTVITAPIKNCFHLCWYFDIFHCFLLVFINISAVFDFLHFWDFLCEPVHLMPLSPECPSVRQ